MSQVPAKLIRKQLSSPFKRIRTNLPPKLGPDGDFHGPGDPQVAPPRVYLPWLADRWALVLSLGCILLGTPISSGLWALFVGEMQAAIFCTFLCIHLCFLLYLTCGCLQITIHQNLWNQLAKSPITKFGAQML